MKIKHKHTNKLKSINDMETKQNLLTESKFWQQLKKFDWIRQMLSLSYTASIDFNRFNKLHKYQADKIKPIFKFTWKWSINKQNKLRLVKWLEPYELRQAQFVVCK